MRVGEVMQVRSGKLAYGGEAVARHNGAVIFVAGAAPDEMVRARIVSVKKNFARAVVEEIVEPSAARRPAPCKYFGVCGGCQLQHINYEAQLKAKSDFIRDSLSRIGHINWAGEIPVVASPEFGYRTRAQVKVQIKHSMSGTDSRDDIAIGFNKLSSHSVCDVESCPILAAPLNAALAELRTVLTRRFREDSGEIPLEIEMAMGDGEPSVEPAVQGLYSGAVSQDIAGINYKFTPYTFFQSNSALLPDLISCAAGSENGAFALDLYCGVGLFTTRLSQHYERVIGVESDSRAARFAAQNLSDNGLTGARIINDRVESFIGRFVGKVCDGNGPRPDLILLDPPRTGAADAMPALIQLRPSGISYMSCDPGTLARDLSVLVGGGYEVYEIKGFDLFPQTYHVETLVRLRSV